MQHAPPTLQRTLVYFKICFPIRNCVTPNSQSIGNLLSYIYFYGKYMWIIITLVESGKNWCQSPVPPWGEDNVGQYILYLSIADLISILKTCGYLIEIIYWRWWCCLALLARANGLETNYAYCSTTTYCGSTVATSIFGVLTRLLWWFWFISIIWRVSWSIPKLCLSFTWLCYL